MFWNIDSPLNILPNALPIPPLVLVSMSMLGLIQHIAPLSVIIFSPA